MHSEDNGSTFGGVMVAVACILCLIIGYQVRDKGIMINFNQQQASRNSEP